MCKISYWKSLRLKKMQHLIIMCFSAYLSPSCTFTLHIYRIFCGWAWLKAGAFLMRTTALIKENQWGVRDLTHVTATLRHEEDRKGGFRLGSCILMAELWQWMVVCCVTDRERFSVAQLVVGSSWREEMGEQRADSCTEVNRRSLCVLPT